MENCADIRITMAKEASLPTINALIARSKAHWDWPPDYMARALPLHMITLDYLRANDCYQVSTADGVLVAFFALAHVGARMLLDNLWVEPEWIGRGIGRRGCEHACQIARERQCRTLWVVPDPPAEGFYVRVGFSDSGERVASRVPGGPIFSVYRMSLET